MNIGAARRACEAKLLIAHHFELDTILEAYETFYHAADTKALKVIIHAAR